MVPVKQILIVFIDKWHIKLAVHDFEIGLAVFDNSGLDVSNLGIGGQETAL